MPSDVFYSCIIVVCDLYLRLLNYNKDGSYYMTMRFETRIETAGSGYPRNIRELAVFL